MCHTEKLLTYENRSIGGLFLNIGRSPAGSCLLDVTGGKKVGQGALDGGEANVRAGLGYLLLGDLAKGALDDGLDALRLGYLAITKVLNTILEFIIGLNHDPQHVLEEGKIVVSVLVPVLGTGLQRFIIGVLALLDEHLDADVLAHNESGAVQEEKCQKAAHAAVSVIERVDAEEVQNEYRHQDQRIIGRGLDGIIVSGAEVQHGIGRLEGRDREEADCFRAVGVLLCNDVVRVFIYTTCGAAAEGIEVPVQLEDAVGARGDVFVGFVDGGQHVAVAGDAVHRSDGQHRQ